MRKKQNIRKKLSLLLAALMLFTLLPSFAAAASSDISGHWAENTLAKWSDKEWLSGDTDGAYRPNASITRAEFMTLINKMEGYSEESADIAQYADVPSGSWYYNAVSAALAAGYISGTTTTRMSPDKPVTREEAFTIIARILGISSDDTSILSAASDGDSVSSWAQAAVAACIREGLAAGTKGKLNPAANITRAESVVLLDRVDSNLRTYALAGTYGPENGTLEASSVIIAGPGVQLRNTAVSGNLTITAAVGEGDVRLSGVTIKGDVYVEGGGSNSLYFADVRVEGGVIVRKYEGENKVRIVASGACNFNAVVLETGAILVTQELKDGTLVKIEIPSDYLAGSTFEFVGNFDNITNNGPEAKINLTGSVNKLTLNASAEIGGTGKITTAEVGAGAGERTSFATRPTNITGAGKGDVTAPAAPSAPGGGGPSGPSGGDTSVTVTSAAALTISVDHNASYTLPATVTANLSAAGTKSFAVVWNPASANTSVCGTFTFEGTLTMVTGYTNPNNIKASLTLTVTPVLNSITISHSPAKQLYLEGEELDLTGLVVVGTYSDGTTRVESVTSADTAGYNPALTDGSVQTVTVTIGGKTASFIVRVSAAAEGELVSVTSPSAVTVENGVLKTTAGLNLPAQIIIVVNDGTNDVSTLAPVTWDVDSADYYPEIKAKQTVDVNGLVTLPESVGNSNAVSLDVTITVNISAAQYTVTFDLNGQTGASIPAQTVDYDGEAAAITSPSSISYDFAGWYDNAEGTGTVWDFDNDTVTGNITLYAKWIIKAYTITFEANGTGAAMPGSLTVNHGSAAAKPADPVLTGSSFIGWYKDAALTQLYDWSTAVTADLKLYPKFGNILSEARDTLTFDVIKGANANEQSIMTNMALPGGLSAYPGITISWVSNNAVIAVDGISGIVTRPAKDAADATVTLTATLTAGSATVTKDFVLVVRKQGIDNIEVGYIDPLFDSGYPLVSILGNGKLQISVKLKEMPANPIECYFIIDGSNAANFSPSVQDVLHGHSGNAENTSESNIVSVSDHDYFLLSDAGVMTYTTDRSIITSSQPAKVGFVLVQSNGTKSSAVTLITIEPETASSADTTLPGFYESFINNTYDALYLYAYEDLNTDSVPAPGDFKLLDNDISIDSVTVTDVEIVNATYSWVKLTLSGGIADISSALSGNTLNVQYTPRVTGIKDLAGNAAAEFTMYTSTAMAAVNSTDINPSAGKMHIGFYPAIKVFGDSSISLEQFKLYNGESEVTLRELSYSYNEIFCDVYLSFSPISSPGTLTWSFVPGDTKDSAGNAVSAITKEDFSEVISGNPYSSVTAAYNSNDESIEITFTDSALLYNRVAACNFALSIDGVSYIPRGFIRNNYSEEGITVVLDLESYLNAKVANAAEVKISYSNFHDQTQIYYILSDFAGAPVPNFGPITVSK